MRTESQVTVADTATLKSFALGMAPPKAAGGRTRGRGTSSADASLPPPPPIALNSSPLPAATSDGFGSATDPIGIAALDLSASPPAEAAPSSAMATPFGESFSFGASPTDAPMPPATFDAPPMPFDAPPTTSFDAPPTTSFDAPPTTFDMPPTTSFDPPPPTTFDDLAAVAPAGTASTFPPAGPGTAFGNPSASEGTALPATPTTPSFEAPPANGSGDPFSTHNLLIAEVVNAHLIGRKLSQYQVVGELRAVPVSVPSAPSEFRFRLRNTHRIEQLKVNEKFVRVLPGGEYLASLPAAASSKPIPLIKYMAAAKWRPVPLFVDLAVLFEGEAVESGEADGGARLQAVVQTNPQLKSTLQNVTVSVTLPDAGLCIGGEGRAPPRPDGSAYDADARKLQWRVSKELVREMPITCSAALCGEGGAELPSELVAAFASTPFQVHFGCDGVTISGIELEVQPAGGTSGTLPVGKLMRRFSAGEYRVTLPKLADAAPVAAQQERTSRASRDSNDCE